MMKNTRPFSTVVKFCTLLPMLMLFHCSSANKTMAETAVILILSAPSKEGNRCAMYSPITIPTAPVVPQVDSQSLQPNNESGEITDGPARKIILAPAFWNARAEFGKLEGAHQRI